MALTPVPLRRVPAPVRTAVACAALVVLLGAPVGLLWSALAPRPLVLPTPGGGLDFADSETKAFIAADGTLFLLGLAAGVLTGVLGRLAARARPVAALVGLVLGAGLAAYVASRTGVLGQDRAALLAAARAGRLPGGFDLPLQLRAHAVLLGWPAGTSLAYAALVLLGREDVRAAPPPLSSG